MEKVKSDVIVVGSGLAGLRAAIEIAKESDESIHIVLISKVQVMRSHSVAPEGGAAAVMMDGDSFDRHSNDTIIGGDYLNDQDAVEEFVREAPKEILQLEHWGMPWYRDEEGKPVTRMFGAHTYARTFFAYDRTGFFLMKTLYDTLLKYKNVEIYQETFAVDIINIDGKFQGLLAFERLKGNTILFTAKAMIIATGGVGRMYPYCTYSHTVTGDGLAMAYRSGVRLRDMEFLQWLPTTLVPQGIPATEALRGHGAIMINKDGKRFMKNYAPERMEMAARDIVTRAMYKEVIEGRGVDGPRSIKCVLLDTRPVGKEKLETIYKTFVENAIKFQGIDPLEEPVPVFPAFHYSMGGIDIVDPLKTNTSVQGIFAAGEAANEGLHGANRLGSNSLSSCLVTGKWAGRSAIAYIKQVTDSSEKDSLTEKARELENNFYKLVKNEHGDSNVYDLRKKMQKNMETNVGVFRNESSLNRAAIAIKELGDEINKIRVNDTSTTYNLEWINVQEVKNMLDLSLVIVHSAEFRKESRGSHFRADYPQRDDKNFLVHSIAQFKNDTVDISGRPVKITKWKPEERRY
ncbi:MAG: FAD-binding protein [Candidatus Thermoplasmatota archaeon]|jgi:succinate dehydrogenase / fumarate reductase flavoprotein subunit|nr:FAD-binding protein [Candidatus Thermoplasmatota archaeon]